MSPLRLSSRPIIVGIMDRDGFITLQRSTGGMTACRVPRTLVPYYVLWHGLLKIRPYKHNFHGEHLRPSISAVQSPPSWRGLDRYSVVGEASGSVDATFT